MAAAFRGNDRAARHPLHPLHRLRPGRFGKMSAADAEYPSAFFADGPVKGGEGGNGTTASYGPGADCLLLCSYR